MKCSITDCNNEAHQDLTYPVESNDGRWRDITLCSSCFEDLSGECADCITEHSGESKCHNCLAEEAENLRSD